MNIIEERYDWAYPLTRRGNDTKELKRNDNK